ncbi:hypothetical protein PENTCL1PPCAC_25354, partial [Pristionchus entomophagus]
MMVQIMFCLPFSRHDRISRELRIFRSSAVAGRSLLFKPDDDHGCGNRWIRSLANSVQLLCGIGYQPSVRDAESIQILHR